MTVENFYKIPLRQWKRWPDDSRIAFNELYSFMLDNQELFRHPMGATQYSECWKTTCWNAAFHSAEIAKKANRHRLVGDKHRVKDTKNHSNKTPVFHDVNPDVNSEISATPETS